jgi:hypothetical protein
MMPRSLEDLWRELAAKGTGPRYIRVDDQHPLDLYAGLDAEGSQLLFLLADSEPSVLAKQFQAFNVTSHHRQDGRWALNVRLLRRDFSRIFAQLCQDLVDTSRTGCSSAQAPDFILDRIFRWERLLARDRSGLLDESSLRGLIGELVFMEQCAMPAIGARAAVEGWHGPLDAAQDFHFADCLVEVKAAGGGSSQVTISSAEQLDVYGSPLFLIVVSLESTSERTDESFNLPQLVSRVRGSLTGNEELLSVFEERLTLAGYIKRDEYEARIFILRGIRHYAVLDNFPRLKRSDLASAIVDIRYVLDVSRCREFERRSCLE